MTCRDCRTGTHVRVEVDTVELETMTLTRYVCACGVCPQRCPARPVAVHTAKRWHHQHRYADGAVLDVDTIRTAHAAESTGRHARPIEPGLPAAVIAGRAQARAAICAAATQPGRHRLPVTDLAATPTRHGRPRPPGSWRGINTTNQLPGT